MAPAVSPILVRVGAILLYLAEKTGKFLSHDMAIKYDEIQRLITQMSTVGPCLVNMCTSGFAPKGNDDAQSHENTQGRSPRSSRTASPTTPT